MRRIRTQLLAMLASLLLLGYFGYHGVYGKHGLNASHQVNAKLASLRAELAALEREKEALEHRISLMLPESLDPDMLDESARSSLNFAHPNDLIILRPAD
jgi:cell division protein FtsB